MALFVHIWPKRQAPEGGAFCPYLAEPQRLKMANCRDIINKIYQKPEMIIKKKNYAIINAPYKNAWAGKTEEWQNNAQFWIKIIREKLDPFRLELTDKSILKFFKEKRSLTVLDAGCGEGYLCRELARSGHKTHGIDFNPELIAAASNLEKEKPLGIEYIVGDLKKIPYPDSFFDAILSNHSINELDNPKKAIKEFWRVLKPNGRIVMLFLHPCFDLNPDDLGNKFAVSYFEKVKVTRECFIVSGIKSPSPYFYLHLPLSEWSAMLDKAGFSIEKIDEPHPSRKTLETSGWWKDNFKRPVFILIQAVKIRG